MLTAKGEEANRVQGFESGTDDYIVKPFSPERSCAAGKSASEKGISKLLFQCEYADEKRIGVFSSVNRS